MSAKNPTNPRWLGIMPALAATLSALALPIYAYKVFQKEDYTDFTVYYRAAVRAQAGFWDQIYSLADGSSPFRYAPLTLPLFRPFAELGPEAARLTWFFLQFAWFGLGFALIHRLLVLTRTRHATSLAALSLLFVLRLCLDSFTIGQVSSLLFLGFSAGALSWSLKRARAASLWLSIPTLFKIGPGFLYFVFLSGRKSRLPRAWLTPIAAVLGAAALSALWIQKSGSDALTLWRNWAMIVAADSQYYDASHYGSQSFKSVLLRLVKQGALPQELALALYAGIAALVCAGIVLFWLLRRPRGILGRGLFFALGVFPYLWFMPETFKYSLTVLAIPVALLLSATLGRERPCRFTYASLLFGALTLSLPGKDLVGDLIFFGNQKLSLPFVATVWLGISVALTAMRHSRPSGLSLWLGQALRSPGIPPWARLPLPPERCALQASLLLPLPMDSSARLEPGPAREALLRFHHRLEKLFPAQDFEILLLPYGDRVSRAHPLAQALSQFLSSATPHARVSWESSAATRPLALREGFQGSQGMRILLGSLEQPCDPAFYEQALALLEGGQASLVRANRRALESRFRVPVRNLELVYGRHRLGLLFNRLVRLLLPIPARDTHSGTLAMSRELATQVFALQSQAGFLFDLELSLIARDQGLNERELPVIVHLSEEKRIRRMLHETLSILSGLLRLARRVRQGLYRPVPARLCQDALISADDWGISPGVNEGILELARLGVLRRASAMAHASYLTAHLQELKRIPDFRLGLHFDLTFGKSSAGRVLLRWLNPFADRARLRSELQSEFHVQLAKLRQAGISPAYFDGHHHIHVVPGVLDGLAGPLREAGITEIRIPLDPAHWRGEKLPLLLLSLLARRRARALGLRFAPCFYPGGELFRDQGRLRSELAARPGFEVIVHPATEGDFERLGIPDNYSAGRIAEFHALRMLSGL